MARPDKAAAVAELTDAFRESSAAVLTEYRGLTVAQLKELRRSLAGNATYAVVKNTLTKIAAREAGVDAFESLLEGPSAIAFVTGDAVEVAKSLKNFGRDHPMLVVKGGVLDGRPITADDVKKLADLESREVLLAKLAGAIKASMQQAVSLFAAPTSQMARLLAALQAEKQSEPEAAAEAPAAEGSAAAEPVAEEPAAEEPTAEATAEAPAAEATAEAPAAEATAEAPAAEATDETPAAEAATEDTETDVAAKSGGDSAASTSDEGD
jgi:large subunit ribosomal protein L10